MYELKLRVNSKTTSAVVEDIKRLSKKIGYDLDESDKRFYIVKTNKYDRNFKQLLSISKEFKGTKLFLNNSEIKNIDSVIGVYGCKKKRYCKGDCDFLGYKWKYAVDILTLDNIEDILKDYDRFIPITERLFEVEEYPDIILKADEGKFTLNKQSFINSFIEYSEFIESICDVFKKEIYINRLKTLPNEIDVKKVGYSESREYKEKIEVEEGIANLDFLVNRFGDEFENRLRKVLDEYLMKKNT